MTPIRTPPSDREHPRFVHDPSFDAADAATRYAAPAAGVGETYKNQYMPDDVTRDLAQRMHYAAYRASRAVRRREADVWRQRYFDLRDRIILGNRKLIFGAVRQRLWRPQHADDLIGECYVVMIRVVAAYNPWLGIRFSTYAYTCLMRALTRLGGRLASDRLCASLSLDAVPDRQLADPLSVDEPVRGWRSIEEFLGESHPLLSQREKFVLERRYLPGELAETPTLEKVGREMGISKERVRQLQESALDKLRQVLVKSPLS